MLLIGILLFIFTFTIPSVAHSEPDNAPGVITEDMVLIEGSMKKNRENYVEAMDYFDQAVRRMRVLELMLKFDVFSNLLEWDSRSIGGTSLKGSQAK